MRESTANQNLLVSNGQPGRPFDPPRIIHQSFETSSRFTSILNSIPGFSQNDDSTTPQAAFPDSGEKGYLHDPRFAPPDYHLEVPERSDSNLSTSSYWQYTPGGDRGNARNARSWLPGFTRGQNYHPDPPRSDNSETGFGSGLLSYYRSSSLQNESTDSSCCPALSWSERLFGFAICFSAGIIVSLLSFGSFSQIFLGHPDKFAVAYTMGNLLSMFSTIFLVGPIRQLENMSDPKRLGASFLYLLCMVFTLLSVYVFKSGLLIVIFVILQWVAVLWYTLSYIPMGRSFASRLITSMVL